MKKIIKRLAKIVLYCIIGVIGLFLIFILVVRIYSPGEESKFKDENGDHIKNSIAVVEDRAVNGVAQRLVIRGEDISNPILLRVHGGPGQAHMIPIYRHFNTSLENSFTVCYWDQRGSGPAYTENTPDSSINLDQIVDDGLKVVEYLKSRFEKEKIFIEGYSWGTVVSAHMVKTNPELFHAYIGIGQVANQPESEMLSYNFALASAQKANDTSAISKLKSIGPPPYSTHEEMVSAVITERSIVSKYSPRLGISSGEMMKMILFNKGAKFNEKYRFLTGKNYENGAPILWPTNARINLFDEFTLWEIPVYIIQGEHDHFTEFSVAKKYFDSIKAPVKRFYEFKGAGHIAIAYDSDRYRSIMLNEILSSPN